jgi:hypothetical protein
MTEIYLRNAFLEAQSFKYFLVSGNYLDFRVFFLSERVMISDSPPRVGSAAARSDSDCGAARPPTPKLSQRFVNPVAQEERVADRARAAQRRKGRKVRCPPPLNLKKETIEGIAAFGLLVRSAHGKIFAEAYPDAAVVDSGKVPREMLHGTSLAWIASACTHLPLPPPLPVVAGKCTTKKRPTADELLQMQSSEAIRASISLSPEPLARSNSVVMLASLEPKKKVTDFRTAYGQEDGYVTSYYLVEKGLPKAERSTSRCREHADSGDSRDGEPTSCSDDDDEYRPREEEPWDRGDGFNDIGEAVHHGRRNLLTLPLLRQWQHQQRLSGLESSENTRTLLDSPRSVFAMAEAGVLLKNLHVAGSPAEEAKRLKLLLDLQARYTRLTHAISQEDFIRMVCEGERSAVQKSGGDNESSPMAPARAAVRLAPNLATTPSVTFGDDLAGDVEIGDQGSSPTASNGKHAMRSPLPSNKYAKGVEQSKKEIAWLLRQFQHHTGTLTATWSHQQEIAAKRLSKSQKCQLLTKEARERKVLLSRAMQTCGNLDKVRALEYRPLSGNETNGSLLSPSSFASTSSPLAILPRSSSALDGAMNSSKPQSRQRILRSGGAAVTTVPPARQRPRSAGGSSDGTYRSDDEDLFLDKRSDDAESAADPDSTYHLHEATLAENGSETPRQNHHREAIGIEGKGQRLTPIEVVRLQYKQAEAKRIADAEAAVKRKDRAVAAAMERLRQSREAQRNERVARSKEVQEKNERARRHFAFEALQLVNQQESKANAAAKRQAAELDAFRQRNENTMRRQVLAYEAKQTIHATERSLLKEMYSMEVHAGSAEQLLHSKEAQSVLIRGIQAEKEKEREWHRRRLLENS